MDLLFTVVHQLYADIDTAAEVYTQNLAYYTRPIWSKEWTNEIPVVGDTDFPTFAGTDALDKQFAITYTTIFVAPVKCRLVSLGYTVAFTQSTMTAAALRIAAVKHEYSDGDTYNDDSTLKVLGWVDTHADIDAEEVGYGFGTFTGTSTDADVDSGNIPALSTRVLEAAEGMGFIAAASDSGNTQITFGTISATFMVI